MGVIYIPGCKIIINILYSRFNLNILSLKLLDNGMKQEDLTLVEKNFNN